MNISNYKKCIILGGGIAGCTAAHLLHKYAPNLQITMYEATDTLSGLCAPNKDVKNLSYYPGKYGCHTFHTDNDAVHELFKELYPDCVKYTQCTEVKIKDHYYPWPINLDTLDGLVNEYIPDMFTRDTVLNEFYSDTKFNTNLYVNVSSLPSKLRELVIAVLIIPYTELQWGRLSDSYVCSVVADRVKVYLDRNKATFRNAFEYIPKTMDYSTILTTMYEDNVVVKFNETVTYADLKPSSSTLIINTTSIDEFYGIKGALPYRTLEFEETIRTDLQDRAITINYSGKDISDTTRIHNHSTHVFKEKPKQYEAKSGELPMYPSIKLTDDTYQQITGRKTLERKTTMDSMWYVDDNIIHLGRLGTYQYLDIDKVILQVKCAIDNIV